MIYHAPRISLCPVALAAAKRATAQLVRAKHTTIKKVEGYLEALFDVDASGKVTGIVCFFDDEARATYVSIVWVAKGSRGKGTFRTLLDGLDQYCKARNRTTITTEVHATNTRMLEVMSRHWDASYVFFTKKIR